MESKDNDILKYFNYDVVKLTDREAYEYYKKHRNFKGLSLDSYNKFTRMVGRIFKEIIKGIKEDEEGIYVSRIGYFCTIKKRTKRKNGSLLLKNDIYKVHFFPDKGLEKLTMEDTENYVLSMFINNNKLNYKPNFKLAEAFLHANAEARTRHWGRVDYTEEINYKPKTTIIDELT